MAPWKKIVLVASGLPLALLSNLARVFALGFISEVYGMEAAGGKVHDASGIVVFVLALGAFMALRQGLEGAHGKA
jgi:exosortase/archaeosortase family protein